MKKKLLSSLLILAFLIPGIAWAGPPVTYGTSMGVTGFGDGTSALPSIFFTADPDTGLYRAAADTVGVAGTLKITTGAAAGNILVSDADGDLSYLSAGATTAILVGGGAANPVWTAAAGSGAPVRANTPTLITPILGAATATSVKINSLLYWGSATAEADEGSVTLPTITANYSGHGFVRISAAGVIADSAEFESGSDGNVSLIRATANVVVGAACADTKICISTAGAQNPIIVQSRNGAAQVEIEFWYK